MIRLATLDDGKALMEMGAEFHEEAGYNPQFPFDPVSFAATLATLGPAGMLLVAERDGEVVGMAALDVAPVLSNRSVRIAREAFWFVRPEHRKGIGREMFSALELLATEHGADFFDAVAEEGKRATALGRIYRSAGLSPAEIVYRKRLRPRCPSDQLSAA